MAPADTNEAKDLNLAIVGLGGAGLASLRHMVDDLHRHLGTQDAATITVIDEFGKNAGGHTYRQRGGDSVTTASSIDSMGVGSDPHELLKIMNAHPESWKEFVHEEHWPKALKEKHRTPDPKPGEWNGEGFNPSATITYTGYHKYLNMVREKIEEDCTKDTRITLKFIKGKAQMIADSELPEGTDHKPKKMITYRDEREKDHHLGDLDGCVFCPGNGLPNPHMSLCSKVNADTYRGRFDNITQTDVENTQNMLLLGSGNGSIAAMMKLRQLGFGYKRKTVKDELSGESHVEIEKDSNGKRIIDPKQRIFVLTLSEDIPHRHLERPQRVWERKYFNIDNIRKLVAEKGDKLQASEVQQLFEKEYQDMLALVRQEKPGFAPIEHYKKHRNEPWSDKHDWRDILDSMDRDAKTGALRDSWNDISAVLPANVRVALETSKEGIAKKYTGASWVNSRHRTPVDHWKIIDEMFADGIVQTSYRVATTHPPVSSEKNKRTVEASLNTQLTKDNPDRALITAEVTEAQKRNVARFEQLLADNKTDRLTVDDIRKDEKLKEIAHYFEEHDGDKKIDLTKFKQTMASQFPKIRTVSFENALVINTAGHTTTIDTIDNAALKHMANLAEDPLLLRGARGGVAVADVAGTPLRKKTLDGKTQTVPDEQLRVVGACVEGGCWNKTIMVDLNRNAHRATQSLLTTLEVIPPAIDTSKGPAFMSAEANRSVAG